MGPFKPTTTHFSPNKGIGANSRGIGTPIVLSPLFVAKRASDPSNVDKWREVTDYGFAFSNLISINSLGFDGFKSIHYTKLQDIVVGFLGSSYAVKKDWESAYKQERIDPKQWALFSYEFFGQVLVPFNAQFGFKNMGRIFSKLPKSQILFLTTLHPHIFQRKPRSKYPVTNVFPRIQLKQDAWLDSDCANYSKWLNGDHISLLDSYADDIWMSHRTLARNHIQWEKYIESCAWLNIILKKSKAENFKQVVTVCGVTFDLRTQVITFDLEKRQRWVVKCYQVWKLICTRQQSSIVVFEQLTGGLNYLTDLIWPGPALVRPFYDALAYPGLVNKRKVISFSKCRTKSPEGRLLKRCISAIDIWIQIIKSCPTLTFTQALGVAEFKIQAYSDASGDEGIGGFMIFDSCCFYWATSYAELRRRYNYPSSLAKWTGSSTIQCKEALAVAINVLVFSPFLKPDWALGVAVDNLGLAYNIAKVRARYDEFTNDLLMWMFSKAVSERIMIIPSHVLRGFNVPADHLSKGKFKLFKHAIMQHDPSLTFKRLNPTYASIINIKL